MEWFYAEGDRQCGPVSDEQLVDLARSGKVLPNSLVWCQGMAHWQSYASVQPGTPLAGSSPMAATGTAHPAERGHTMPVIGGRDMEAGALGVRLHHGGPQGAKPKGEVVADILASIKERRA